MAFITRVRMEGAGESPDAIRAEFDELQEAMAFEDESPTDLRVADEVFERVANRTVKDWYKGRRVVWFVEPGAANDPNAGNS